MKKALLVILALGILAVAQQTASTTNWIWSYIGGQHKWAKVGPSFRVMPDGVTLDLDPGRVPILDTDGTLRVKALVTSGPGNGNLTMFDSAGGTVALSVPVVTIPYTLLMPATPPPSPDHVLAFAPTGTAGAYQGRWVSAAAGIAP